MSLSPKQRHFIDEFLANGGVASEAARSAGYGSPKQRGSELLKNPAVAAVIAAREGERREALDIDSAEIVRSLWYFVEGAKEGRYPAGAGVRALGELARLGGLYRSVTESYSEEVIVTMDFGHKETAA